MSESGYETDGEIAIVTFENPPVNALSEPVRRRVDEALSRAENDPVIAAVVLTGAGKTFSYGADIAEFGTDALLRAPNIIDLQKRIHRFPKPVVAAIHGLALGGALEIAMAADARVAVASAKVGLPEVNVGTLPGAGGTMRFPRLAGVPAAIDALTSGKAMTATRAHELGLIDRIVEDALAGGITYAREIVASGTRPVPALERTEKVSGIDPAVFAEARKTIGRKARGRTAPFAIIDCIEAACTMDAQAGLAFAIARGGELEKGDQQAALIHAFRAERAARIIPDVPKDTRAKPIESAAVVGAGLMGGGIAMNFANVGIPVSILDVNQESLDRGVAVIRRNYDISVDRGSLSRDRADRALSLITPVLAHEELGDADIVIEAALERMEAKQAIFAILDRVMKPGAILATNTSYLDIDQIAAATSRPQDVIGTHFFSPANVMKLLENVRGAKTSAETIETVMALGRKIGKIPVLAGNTEGFIGNRMMQYYTGEAEFLMEQGATPEQIDRVALRFGMVMGPIATRDLMGMETAVVSRAERAKKLPAGERMSPIVERLVEAGRFGQKNGKGFYRYEGREKHADPETAAIIEGVARDFGVTRRTFNDEEVEARLFAPLVNEGAKELEDGTAIRAGDIDIVWINGYNFPAHRGGPMYWGERYGLDRILTLARAAEQRNGPRWAPGPLLERLAVQGKGWSDA